MIEKIEKILGQKCKEIRGAIHTITEKGAYYKTKQGKIIGLAIVDFSDPDLSFLRELKSKEALKELNLNNCYLGDISALKDFHHLEKLNLGRNHLQSIAPLEGMIHLKSLNLKGYKNDKSLLIHFKDLTEIDLSWCAFKDLSLLKGMKKLKDLKLIDNQIVEISELGNHTNLKKLELSYNEIKDFSPLGRLKKLTLLGLDETGIEDIGILKELKALQNLSLAKNPLKKLSPLNALPNISELDLGFCELESSDFKSVNLDGLEVFYGRGNQLDEISFLEDSKKLKELHLKNNKIVNLEPLEKLAELEILSVSENQVCHISPLSKLVKLKKLFLSDNTILDLWPLSRLKNLKTLTLYNNAIEDLGALTGLTKMEALYLHENKILDISPLKTLKKLHTLTLNGNLIRDITPLRGATKIRSLYLYGNNETLDEFILGYFRNEEITHIKQLKPMMKTPAEEKLELLYVELESRDSVRIKAGLEKLKSNASFYKKASKRYLNFIKLRTKNDEATLDDFEKAQLSDEEAMIFFDEEYLGKENITFDLSDEKEALLLYQFIAAITKSIVNIERFKKKANKCTSLDQLKEVWQEEPLLKKIGTMAKLHPEGWFSKICYQLSRMKLQTLFYNRQIPIEVRLSTNDAFLFFLRQAMFSWLDITIYQANVEFSDMLWLFPELPNIGVGYYGSLDIDKSSLSFKRDCKIKNLVSNRRKRANSDKYFSICVGG